MPTLQDDLDQLHEATRDLAYELAKGAGLLRLIARIGLTPKHWIRERQIRDLHRHARAIDHEEPA